MAWFGVRTVCRWGQKRNGAAVFEERVVVFEADSSDEAHEKARTEAAIHAQGANWVIHPDQVSHEQDGERLIDAYEVGSGLFEADCSLDECYTQRYAHFDYHPE